MFSMGFRAETKRVHYVVIDAVLADSKGKVVSHGKFAPPPTYGEAEALHWYRDRVIQELEKHKPERSGVRFPETFGRKGVTVSDQQRLRIEGVILEAIETKKVRCFGGALAQISSAIGTESAKAYKSKDEIRGINWEDLNDYEREAVLAALAALK